MKDVLHHQLEIEKTALEAERRKTSILQDQVKEKVHHFLFPCNDDDELSTYVVCY